MYNSKKYWNERKDPNKYNHIMGYEKKAIIPFVKGSKTVFDFGCGIGRTLPLYKDKHVTGLDFSSMYKDRFKGNEHIVHDVHENPLPFNDNYFDCGVLIKVTLHANDKEVKNILAEVGRVCKKVLVITYDGTREGLAPHVFCHDYKTILTDLGFDIVSAKHVEDNQIVIEYR